MEKMPKTKTKEGGKSWPRNVKSQNKTAQEAVCLMFVHAPRTTSKSDKQKSKMSESLNEESKTTIEMETEDQKKWVRPATTNIDINDISSILAEKRNLQNRRRYAMIKLLRYQSMHFFNL